MNSHGPKSGGLHGRMHWSVRSAGGAYPAPPPGEDGGLFPAVPSSDLPAPPPTTPLRSPSAAPPPPPRPDSATVWLTGAVVDLSIDNVNATTHSDTLEFSDLHEVPSVPTSTSTTTLPEFDAAKRPACGDDAAATAARRPAYRLVAANAPLFFFGFR